MKNIVLGLGALGAGAYTITRGGVFQGDEEENNEVITGQFPGQGAGVGGSPITSGQAPGPSVNIEAPDTQPMDLEGLDSGFSSKKEETSSDSSGSSSSSGSSDSSGMDFVNDPNVETETDGPVDFRESSKKEKESSDSSGMDFVNDPNVETETDGPVDFRESSKKEETVNDTEPIGGIF